MSFAKLSFALLTICFFMFLTSCEKETILQEQQPIEDIGIEMVNTLEYLGNTISIENSSIQEKSLVLNDYFYAKAISEEEKQEVLALRKIECLSCTPSQYGSIDDWIAAREGKLTAEDLKLYTKLKDILGINYLIDHSLFNSKLNKLKVEASQINSSEKVYLLNYISIVQHMSGFIKEAKENIRHPYHNFFFGNSGQRNIIPCPIAKILTAITAYNDCLTNGGFDSLDDAKRTCAQTFWYILFTIECK